MGHNQNFFTILAIRGALGGTSIFRLGPSCFPTTCISSQGEWTRNSRFVAPNLRGAIAPSRFGCDESTCFASILRLKMHSDMQLAILFLLLIQMHMITSEVLNSVMSNDWCVYSKDF